MIFLRVRLRVDSRDGLSRSLWRAPTARLIDGRYRAFLQTPTRLKSVGDAFHRAIGAAQEAVVAYE